MGDLMEDVISSTIECFQELRLNELDERWVSDVIMNEFSHFEECPTPVELLFPDDIMSHLSKATDVCRKWVEFQLPNESFQNSMSDNDPVIWKILMENDIEIKYILGLVFLFCSRSVKQSSTLYEKQLGLRCGKLYLTLLQITGSNAYSVYHPGLIQAVVNCLKFPKEKTQNKKRQPASVYRNDIVNHRKRVHRENLGCANEPEEQVEAEESYENEDAEANFSAKECKQLFFNFADMLKDLINFLKIVSLGSEEEIIDHIIIKLVECAACERHYTDFDFSKDVNSIFQLHRRCGPAYVVTALSYKALLALCEPLHGNEEENYLLVLRYLSSHILCTKAKNQTNQTIPHQYLVIKDNAISFVCYNLERHSEYSLTCTKILLQQLCVRVNDKSDYRAKVAHAVITILRQFPVREFAVMNKWFELFVNQSRIQDRVVGLEILSFLLAEPPKEVTEDLPENLKNYVTPVPIVNAIIDRCNDKASTVRTKAMYILANNLERIVQVLTGNYNRKKRTESESEVSSNSSLSLDLDSDVESEKMEHDQVNVTHGKNKEKLDVLATMIRHRTKDFKVHGRKAALQALENLICLEKSYLTDENLELLYDAASDPNVTMKKACIASISAILDKYKTCLKVQSCWLRCVLPLIMDPEKSVQCKSLEVMEVQFLLNISGSDSERSCAWSLLNEISCGEHYNLQRFLSKAFTFWKVEGKLRSNLRTVLERELGTKNNSAAWLLLQVLSVNIELKNTTFIVNYWDNNYQNKELHPFTKRNILQVISNTCKHISCERLKSVQEKLESDIENFHCPVELIGVSVETLFKLYEVQSNKTDMYQRLITRFSTETMKASEKFLSAVVLEKFSSFELHSEDLICQHLFTLGDLALLCPACVPKKTFLIIQSMIASPLVEGEEHYSSSGHSDSPLSRSSRILSPKVQAVAFVTLGKLCLQNEELTKKCVPALACELANSKYYVIRNNIIIVLADLCIRYTSIVDLYIPSISACLKDRNSLVRHQTFSLLSKLLQEDYIKCKDSLMLRMLSMVVDEDKKIRSLAEYCFGYMMVKRNPSIFCHHFIECIFFFNAHPGTISHKFSHFDQDTKLFSLKGDRNRSKRMSIYKFMVKHTVAPKRFALSLKLCREILGAIADNVIVLDEDGKAVVKDCLNVLSSEEIKLPSLHGSNTEESEENEVAEAIAVKAAQRVYLVQVVIPIVTSLKKLLEELKSPLLNDLMIFLREICKDYKNELKDMFAADKQLGKEIEFDIRRYEKECEKENERRQMEGAEVNNGELRCVTPSRSGLNNREVLIQSVERAKSVSKQVSQAQNGSLLRKVHKQNLSRNGITVNGTVSQVTGKNLPSGSTNSESQNNNNAFCPPSSSKEMQPFIVLEKLPSKVIDQYTKTSPEKATSKHQKHKNAKSATSPKQTSVDPVLCSPSQSALSTNSESLTPVVRIKRLDKKHLDRMGIPVSSTPIAEQSVSNFATIHPDISGVCSSESSCNQRTSCSPRRTSRRAKQRK